jgi:carbamate kinase
MANQAATVICQTEVAADDPAFSHPSKPIGSFMDEEMAERRRQQGWDLIEDANRGFRRVVASPKPIRIVEMPAISRLVEAGVTVVTAGGGGIPVVAGADGSLTGVAAVIDKDLASALLANNLGADLLLISTAVEKVALNFGTPTERSVDHLTANEAREYLAEGSHFAPGSMAPKIQAILDYLDRGGAEAIVTDPDNVERALAGETGTHFTNGDAA